MRDGRMVNNQLTNYIIPTTLDTPPIEVIVLENPYQHGPFGAKGVGEMPIDGPAPAVVNALRHAGYDLRGDSRDARAHHGRVAHSQDADPERSQRRTNRPGARRPALAGDMRFTLNGKRTDVRRIR